MNAYSRLNRLLKQRRISVPDLQRQMRSQGLNVNVKSLYRLDDESQPLDRLDMGVAGAICRFCAVPLSEWIVFEEESGSLRTLSSEKQRPLDTLMTKNNAGELSSPERDELLLLARAAELITLTNARLLAQQQPWLMPASVRLRGAS